MTSNEILRADVLDILFHNRNKEYGAYALRKTYSMRLFLSVILTIGGAAGLLIFVAVSSHISENRTLFEPPPVELRPFELPLPETPPMQDVAPPPAAPAAAQEHFTDLITIVPDKQFSVEDVVPPVSDLTDAAFGTEKTAGENTVLHTVQPLASVTESVGQPAASEATVYDINAVEEPALFPGGAEAFSRYLAQQLGSPEGLAPGETRTAKVQFIISKDGTVLANGVLQSAGAAFDALIIKALRRSPKWKPARMHGEAVPVALTLPVTFVGTEE